MPKTEVLSLFLIKMWDRALSARRAGAQTFIRHVSSEADSKGCPGVSEGQAKRFFFFFFLNMVFIKKASISGEVWFSSEAGKEAGRKKGCLLGFETTLIYTAAECALSYKLAFGE